MEYRIYTFYNTHAKKRSSGKSDDGVFVTTCDTRTDDYRDVQVGSDNVTGSCNLRQSFLEKLNNNKFISILIF